MKKIGLTGGIGSGKSTVSAWLRERGLPVIDADASVHSLYERPDFIQQIVAVFGQDYVTDGAVDRRRLGDLVFRDEQKRATLEGLIYPALHLVMNEARAEALRSQAPALIFDIPLLWEKGFNDDLDEIWVVYATPEQQISRAMARNNMTAEQVRERMAAQIPLMEKARRADVVILNTETQAELASQLEDLYKRICV